MDAITNFFNKELFAVGGFKVTPLIVLLIVLVYVMFFRK